MAKTYPLKIQYNKQINSLSKNKILAKNYLVYLIIILVIFMPLKAFSNPYENILIEKELPLFSKVDIEGNFLVKILKESKNRIEIYGDRDLITLVIVNVISDTLYISMTSDTTVSTPIEIKIFTPGIVKLTSSDKTNTVINDIDNDYFEVKLNGNTNTTLVGKTKKFNISVSGKSKLNTEKFQLNNNNIIFVNLSGLADISLKNIKSESIKVKLSDLSTLTVSGTTKNLELDAIGSGVLNGKFLRSINSIIKMDDCTEANIDVQSKLNVSLYGSSILEYIGKPTIKKKIFTNAKLNQIK